MLEIFVWVLQFGECRIGLWAEDFLSPKWEGVETVLGLAVLQKKKKGGDGAELHYPTVDCTFSL